MYKRLLCVLLSLAMIAVLFAGCEQIQLIDDPDGTDDLEHSENAEAGFRRTTLYYATEDGYIVPVMRAIPWEEGIGRAALGYLVDTDLNHIGANAMGLCTLIPDGTKLSLSVSDGIATLDMSGYTAHDNAEDERAMVVMIVNTLTEFDTIESVQFKLEGQDVKKLPAGTSVKDPITRYVLNAEDGEISASTEGAYAMTLYFPNRSASLNVPVARYIDYAPTFEGAVKELMEGPNSEGLLSFFPEGTGLIGASIENGVARVDVTSDFLMIEYTEGLFEALYDALFLTANALEPVYDLAISVNGEPYLPAAQVVAPMYPNEYRG